MRLAYKSQRESASGERNRTGHQVPFNLEKDTFANVIASELSQDSRPKDSEYRWAEEGPSISS